MPGNLEYTVCVCACAFEVRREPARGRCQQLFSTTVAKICVLNKQITRMNRVEVGYPEEVIFFFKVSGALTLFRRKTSRRGECELTLNNHCVLM